MISKFKFKWRLATGYYSKGFKYLSDKDTTGYREFYKTPEQTLSEGGDCEDWAILVYHRMTIDGRQKGVTFEHWKNIEPNKSGHMVLRLANGKCISNHGSHGKTVRGYQYYKTVTIEEINDRINKHKQTGFKLKGNL